MTYDVKAAVIKELRGAVTFYTAASMAKITATLANHGARP